MAIRVFAAPCAGGQPARAAGMVDTSNATATNITNGKRIRRRLFMNLAPKELTAGRAEAQPLQKTTPTRGTPLRRRSRSSFAPRCPRAKAAAASVLAPDPSPLLRGHPRTRAQAALAASARRFGADLSVAGKAPLDCAPQKPSCARREEAPTWDSPEACARPADSRFGGMRCSACRTRRGHLCRA